MYTYPKTKEEYWDVVNKYWEDMRNILTMFLSEEDVQKAESLKKSQDVKIANSFQDAWAAAPDSPVIHGIKGWHILCDLCSEAYLLYDDEEQLPETD